MQRPVQEALCICLTPLHVLIAEKVAQNAGERFAKGVYFSYNNDQKTMHYFRRMAEFCQDIEFVQLPNESIKTPFKHLHILHQRWQFRRRFAYFSSFSHVYLPTSYNIYLMVLLAITRHSTLHTFDDGILNIDYEGTISPYRRKSLFARVFAVATGIYYSIDDLVALSSQHYSIYPASQNVCSNVVEISLIETGGYAEQTSTGIRRIFIGPAPEADASVWDKVNRKILDIQPQEFLPHPRDIHQKAKNVHYTETHLIAEDYVINLLQQHTDTAVEVYGLQSSALLHLAQLPRVTVFSFIDNNPNNAFLIKLMADYGVKFID